MGKNIFENCKSLTDIESNKCERIPFDAFKGCSKLESVYFPECKKIEASAFEGCDSIRKIVVAENCEFEQSSIPLDKILNGCVEFISHNNSVKKVTNKKFEKSVVEDSVKEEVVEDQEFYQIDDATGVRVYAQKGVFPANSHILVRRIDSKSENNDLGDSYSEAVENLDDDNKKKIENINLYSIKIMVSNSNILQPKGKVTVMFPVHDTFDESDLDTLRIISGEDITCSNNIVEVDGRKYCTFLTDHFSIYCLVDKLTEKDFIENLMPYLVICIILEILVAGYFVLKSNLENRI